VSELRQAARRLVETRSETFESRHAKEDSMRRLDAALAKIPQPERRFKASWSGGEGAAATLTATFEPLASTQRYLRLLSVGMAFIVLLAALSWFFAERAFAWMATITAVLAFLGFPFVILGMASHQDAREARIRRAIRIALEDEDERLPPPQRWADED
jgi:hypothetical protein